MIKVMALDEKVQQMGRDLTDRWLHAVVESTALVWES